MFTMAIVVVPSRFTLSASTLRIVLIFSLPSYTVFSMLPSSINIMEKRTIYIRNRNKIDDRRDGMAWHLLNPYRRILVQLLKRK